jgi:hypothetical protein
VKVGNTESAEKNRAYTGRLKKNRGKQTQAKVAPRESKRKERTRGKVNERRNSTPSPSSCSQVRLKSLQFCKIIHKHCALEI